MARGRGLGAPAARLGPSHSIPVFLAGKSPADVSRIGRRLFLETDSPMESTAEAPEQRALTAALKHHALQVSPKSPLDATWSPEQQPQQGTGSGQGGGNNS